MLGLGKSADNRNILDAISRSQAVIEFDLKGNILTANSNFCMALGYELTEIVGKHHRIFCDRDLASSRAYQEFWESLARGEFQAKEYRRIRKDGSVIWIEASYNPIFRSGKPYKVVKIATDITAKKIKAVEDAGKLEALSRSQATIEFFPDGTIITANPNFCATVNYDLKEIEGKHHRMFCDPAYAASPAYANFWQRLASGEFISDEFVRYGKNGKEIWIQAAYNPVLDEAGKVVKVVKFATDVTPRMSAITVLAEALQALAEGDLVQRLDNSFVPSMEKLRHDFNDVVGKLQTTMQTIAHNASTIRIRLWRDTHSRGSALATNRTAGRLAGGNRCRTGGNHHHGYRCQPARRRSREAGAAHERSRRTFRRNRSAGNFRHGRDFALLRRNHQHYRRHR